MVHQDVVVRLAQFAGEAIDQVDRAVAAAGAADADGDVAALAAPELGQPGAQEGLLLLLLLFLVFTFL